MKQKDFYFHFCDNCDRALLFLYKKITGEIVYYCKYCQKNYELTEGEENV